MCVCGILKLASLSKLIFGRFFLKKKKDKLVGSMCVCVWIIKVDRLNTLIFGRLYIYIYMYVDFLSWQVEYIDIWQVVYICIYMDF